MTITKNLAKDELRRRKRDPIPMELWDIPAPADTEAKRDYHMLVDAIRSMPGPIRAVLEMRVIEERTFREIARSMGCSEDTAKRRYERARAALMERMTGEEK